RARRGRRAPPVDSAPKGPPPGGPAPGGTRPGPRRTGSAPPPIGERMDRLDEALTVCRLMFTEERPSFQGSHFRIERPRNYPRPVQARGPRIWIGGGGEKRTLRLLARHGDIGHWVGPLEALCRQKEILARHCEAEGRDPD